MPFRIGSVRADPQQGESVRIVTTTVESIRIEASGLAKIAAGGLLFSMPLERYLRAECDPRIMHTGTNLDENTMKKLENAQKGYDCYVKASSLACRSEQGCAVISAKLSARGYEKKDIDETLALLAFEGLIDDRRFASAWVATRLSSRAEGPSSLLAGLLKKGVSRIDAQEAIAVAFANEMRHDILRAAAVRLGKRGAAGSILFSRLRKLGFRRQEILEAGIPERDFPAMKEDEAGDDNTEWKRNMNPEGDNHDSG